MYRKNVIILLAAILCSLSISAQPLIRHSPLRGHHHTQRLPGVNERRLARLEKMREANVARRHRQGPWRAQTVPETQKGLVLLVEFSDAGGKLKSGAATQWNNRFNQEGFSQYNHIGSVRDYFREQSYGLLTIDFDVVGPLTLSKTREYYGSAPNSNLDDRAAEMVIDALALADSQVNYADYDWDGDGYVDQVYVIYAGVTYYDTPGYIWPHEWDLSSARTWGSGSGRQRKDGVYIDTYAVSNELANASTLEGIGTACHEFSHCLGYPDFYDTDYTGGTAAQNWDVLDGGSYNGAQGIGEVPSPYTAYERWVAGWIDLIPLDEPCKVIGMPAINEEGVAYIITNTGNTNEYYVLENRQQRTFGTGNRGHGLMVWHIDYDRTAWNNNTVNQDKNHQRMTFLPADGQVGVLRRNDDGSYQYDISADDEAGDPYPGRVGVDEVQPLTWFIKEKNGTKTHPNLIHGITETADGKINFIYGNPVILATPEFMPPTDISDISFTVNWLPVEGATSYTLQVETMDNAPAPATVLEEDFSKFSSVSDGSSVTNSLLNKYTQTAGWSASGLFGTGGDAVRISSGQVCGYLMTPALQNEAGQLVVEFEAAYYNTDNSSVVVSVLDGNQTISSQTVQLSSEKDTYTCTFESVPTGCKVKFGSTAVKKRFYLYNVNIMDMSGEGGSVETYAGLTATSFVVGPINSEMYYYRVQAVCDDGTSEWTDWMNIDMASPIQDLSQSVGKSSADVLYDLSGRRLQNVPKRGLYIRNGRTYLLR